MGDLFLNESESGFASEVQGNSSVLGLDEYESDEALAAVKLFGDYPVPLLRFASACCMLFMLVGIPGNLITIIALARCKKVRNATAFFIISLSCSDLLFCCFILPLAASTFWRQSWPHGKILCRMFPLARYALVAVSLFTVLAITINRYIMIFCPRLYPKLYKKLHLSLFMISLWLFPIGTLIPTYLEIWGRFSLDPIIGSCTIIPDENDRSPKKFLFIAAFIVPSLAIIVCYARILWIVRKTGRKSRGPVYRRPVSELENTQIDCTINGVLAQSPANKNRRNTTHIASSSNDTCKIPLNCFVNPGAEFSSSADSSPPEEILSIPRTNARRLRSETVSNFRKSFVATFRRPTAPPKPRLPTKKDKKLLTMIVAIMVSFFVCHLPITLTKTIFQEFTSHPIANIVGYILIYLTTCVNPIIYVVMSIEYRQAYKSLLHCGR